MNTKVFMHAIVATAMLATATTLTACLNSHADNAAEAKIESVELIRTSQSWDGVELPERQMLASSVLTTDCPLPLNTHSFFGLNR